MDGQFWKLFATLFGIGAAISFAKSLKLKSNRTWKEIVSEMIISGFLAVSAATIYIFYPAVNMAAVAGVAALLAILGVAFLSEKIEKGLQMAADKYLKKDE